MNDVPSSPFRDARSGTRESASRIRVRPINSSFDRSSSSPESPPRRPTSDRDVATPALDTPAAFSASMLSMRRAVGATVSLAKFLGRELAQPPRHVLPSKMRGPARTLWSAACTECSCPFLASMRVLRMFVRTGTSAPAACFGRAGQVTDPGRQTVSLRGSRSAEPADGAGFGPAVPAARGRSGGSGPGGDAGAGHGGPGILPWRREGFAGYAVSTIRGEIRRYFRDRGWLIRPRRRLQRAIIGQPPWRLGSAAL